MSWASLRELRYAGGMSAVGSACCPHCAARVATRVGRLPFGAVDCDGCGRPLWFVTVEGERKFFAHAEAKFVRRLFDALPHHQLLPRELGMDSMDVVEVVIEFEEALERAG